MSLGFRPEALKKMNAPEQLDTAIRIVSPLDWLASGALLAIILAIIAWGFLGRLSTRVDGLGMLLAERGSVQRIQSQSDGTVADVLVNVGSLVAAGAPLVRMHVPGMVEKLDAAISDLAAAEQEQAILGEQVAKALMERHAAADRERTTLSTQLREEEAQLVTARGLLAAQEELAGKGFTTRVRVEEARDRVANTSVETLRTKARMVDAQLAVDSFEAEQQRLLSAAERRTRLARDHLAELRAQADSALIIRSPVEGEVVEIAVRPGDGLAAHGVVGEIVAAGETRLVVQAVIPVADGKKIQVGMPAQLALAPFEADIYGTLLGEVVAVSAVPQSRAELMRTFGNEELVSMFAADGAPFGVTIALRRDQRTASGYRWSSSDGPPTTVAPNTLANVSIKAAEAPPISLVLPILKTWSPWRKQ